MTITMAAFYDGEVLIPEEPVLLEPGARVRLTIELVEKSEGAPYSFLKTARFLKLESPPDWSHGD